MLLNRVMAVNVQGDILELPLDETATDFVVQEIQGLGPAKATLVSSGFASIDGAQFHTSRLEPRNIIVKLGLAPAQVTKSVYDLRAELYGFFMPKTEVLLRFNIFNPQTDSFIERNRIFEIKGRIESFEVSQFVKDPTVDLSVMCFKPAFEDPETTVFEGFTVDDLTEVELDYKGNINTGFLFSIFPNRTVNDFAIYQRPSNQKLYSVMYNDQLINEDELRISSERGNKYVHLVRDAVEMTRLYSLSPQSNWLELHPGPNHLRVYTSGLPIFYRIEYKAKYGGL